jgi:mannose/fructose/N-acetylgalactosamine-specific phosphotransferase system component IIC
VSEWLLLAFLGAVVSTDTTAFLQGMLHQPLVACTLAGSALGQPLEGAYFGALLAHFPEIGTVSLGLTSGALMALASGTVELGIAAIAVAVLTLPLAWAASLLVDRQRELQSLFLPRVMAAVEVNRPGLIRWYLLVGVGHSLLRGAVTALVTALISMALLRLLGSLPLAAGVPPYAVLAGMVGIGLGVVFELFDTRESIVWVLAGVAVTATGLLL